MYARISLDVIDDNRLFPKNGGGERPGSRRLAFAEPAPVIGMIGLIRMIGISGMIGLMSLMRMIRFPSVSGPRRDCSQLNDNEAVVGERWNLGTDSSSVVKRRPARPRALGLPAGLARLARLGTATC